MIDNEIFLKECINYPDQGDYTMLEYLCLNSEESHIYEKYIEKLIAHGVDVNKNYNGPINHIVVHKNNLKVLKMLLDAGAIVNETDSWRLSILSIAEKSGKSEMVSLLKSYGAK
jgi:ankyrin repeat protein